MKKKGGEIMSLAGVSLIAMKWIEVFYYLFIGVIAVFGLPMTSLLWLKLGLWPDYLALFIGGFCPFFVGLSCYKSAMNRIVLE